MLFFVSQVKRNPLFSVYFNTRHFQKEEKMRKILFAAFIYTVLAGCSQQENNQSYAALLMADGKDYYAEGLSEQYSLGIELGTISNKLDASVKPSQNFWSNYLDKGTVLYRAKEKEDVILVKKGEKIEVFKAAE